MRSGLSFQSSDWNFFIQTTLHDTSAMWTSTILLEKLGVHIVRVACVRIVPKHSCIGFITQSFCNKGWKSNNFGFVHSTPTKKLLWREKNFPDSFRVLWTLDSCLSHVESSIAMGDALFGKDDFLPSMLKKISLVREMCRFPCEKLPTGKDGVLSSAPTAFRKFLGLL